MTQNQILVQNIETFETITRLTVDVERGETANERIDQYFSKNSNWGIVSLDVDADGEYMNVLLVAPVDGPDFVMDMTTGEMEPVEDIDPQAELAAKMDIMLELDMNDASQDDILAMINAEASVPAPVENIIEDDTPVTITRKPRKTRKTKSKAKGAKMSQPKKIRNYEILVSFIEANPGVSRTDVFADAGLQSSLRTKAQVKSIAAGDKAEVKRWNRRLNFLIRESKRQGVDIQIERKGRVAHYTINTAKQLELPFTEAAAARNEAIVYADGSSGAAEANAEAAIEAKFDARRAEEPENVSMNFEDLLATLDNDNALITSDDQIAFENAREMLK